MWDKFGIFLVISCVTWRLSYMLVNEKGPFHIFVFIRNLAGIEHDEDSVPVSYPDNLLAEILSCIYCTSVWVGIFLTIFAWFTPIPVLLAISMPFALSAMAILIDSIVSGR